MKTFRKVLGVVLAIAMLAGVFSMMASALAPDSAVDLYISTDKAVYAKGDTIIITVSQQVDPAVGDMTIAGTYAIGFPSAAIEFKSDSTDLSAHPFTALVAGYDSSIAGFHNAASVASQGVSVDAGAAWDAVFGLIVTADGTAFDNTAKTALFTYEMKIKDDAPDGTYTLGFNKDGYDQYYAFSADAAMGGIYGYDDDYGYGTTANYAFNSCTFTVGATATMEVNPITNANSGYGQIRFHGTDPAADHDFDVRIGSTITNVNEVYTDEAAFAADIVDIGFIFSASAMSTADAATVAEGGSVSGITKKSLDDQYLQRITSGETYKFFCFVSDIPYADVNDTLYAYAYVQTSANGYFYYPAVINITYSDLYLAYVGDYNTYLASL